MLPIAFGDVIINEIMYDPNQCASEGFCEWVELFNNGSITVDLSSWQLEENDFNDGNISPGEYIIIAHRLNVSDGGESFEAYWGNNDSVWNSTDASYQAIDGNFGVGLNDGGEIINLSNGTVTKFAVDYTPFESLAADNGKTLIFYKGNFTESAFVNGTPGANNDQFAPDFNKWLVPSSNNSFIKDLVNVTVNITDVTNVSSVLIGFNGTNFTTTRSNDTWFFILNTTKFTDGKYNLTAYFNDNGSFSNTDTLFNATIDTTLPSFSNLISSPATIFNDLNATISTVWTDANSIASVVFEHNATGTLKNFTATSLANNNYSLSINSSVLQNHKTVGWKSYATDNSGRTSNTSLQTFSVTNRDPVLDSIGNRNATEDLELRFNITASDLDGDTLAYSSNQSNISITKINNSLATVSFTPTNDNVGNNTIKITVNDSSLTDFETFLITVANVNDAPAIISFFPVENKTIAEVEGQLFNVTPSDIDAGDTLTVYWFKNGTFRASGSSVNISNLTKGIFNITAIVNDSSGAAARNEWLLAVTLQVTSSQYSSPILNLNSSQLESVTNVTINHSTFGSVDFGNNTLNFSGVTNLENVVNITNGVIAIDTDSFPKLNKSASVTMKSLNFTKTPLIFSASGFKATNGNLCPESICTNISYDKSTGILKFNVAHFTAYFMQTNTTNGPPRITSSAITAATEGSAYSYDADATDPDSDTLAFSLTVSPSGMGISSSTGLITWTPSISQLGTHNVTVSVSDSNLTDNQSFQINVSRGAKLVIKDLDVKVDGKSDKSVQNSTRIRKEVKPGSDVEFKMEIENRFTNEEDLEINDIESQVTIEEIDDGDDLEEEADEFDLNAGKDKTIIIKFDIPLKIDEDTFDAVIDIEGEDENGTAHDIRWILDLEVEKEKHDIIISKLSLNPTTVSCSRTAALSAEITNLGRDEEDEAALEILSHELGISFRQENIELEEGVDNAEYEKTLAIKVPEGQEAGIYPITINTYFDNDDLDDSKTIELNVKDCEKAAQKKEAVKEKPKSVEVKKPPVVKEEKPQATQITFSKNDGYLILVATTFILLTGLTVFAVGAAIVMLRKR